MYDSIEFTKMSDLSRLKNAVHEQLSRYSDTKDITNAPELLSAEGEHVVCRETESLSAITCRDNNLCTEKISNNDNSLNIGKSDNLCKKSNNENNLIIDRSDISNKNTNKYVKMEQGEKSHSDPLFMISNMNEIQIERECTPQEMYFQVSSDIDVVQSEHVDQMYTKAYDHDIKIKYLKTEWSSPSLHPALDSNNQLKGSILDLILYPIDVSYTNRQPCFHQCRVCPKIFRYTSTVARHERTHTERLSCAGMFRDTKHVVVTESCSDGEVSDREESLSCTRCNNKFDTFTKLTRHIRQVHSKTKQNSETQLNVPETSHASDHQDPTEQPGSVTQSIDLQPPVSLIDYSPDLCTMCCICQKIFESEVALRIHYKSKHRDKSNRIISCPCCDYTTKDVRSFAIHGRRHTGEKPYMCNQCGVRYMSRNALHKHERSVHEDVNGNDIRCPQCGEKFKHGEAFRLHRQTHTEERPYVCEQCNKRFLCRKSLTRHLQYVHDKTFKHVRSECNEDCINIASQNELMISDERVAPSLLHHDPPEQKKDCASTQSDKSFPLPPSRLLQPTSKDIEKHPFLCIQCGEVFKSQTQLHLHEIGHDSKCLTSAGHDSKCLTSAVQPTSLIQTKEPQTPPVSFIEHKNGYYSPGTSEKCCICQETFISETVLRNHYKSKHSSKTNKTISCVCCKYETNDARSFIIHGRRHTGEKPYVCMKCGHRFISQNMMGKHDRSVHQGDTGYENKSQQCIEWFQQVEAFKLHRQTHNDERPYVCEQCDKRFVSQRTLTVHTRYVHDKSFTHICAQCGKGCRNSTKLKLHVIHHHEGKCNYLCTLCGGKYPSNTLLKKHALSHSVKDIVEHNGDHRDQDTADNEYSSFNISDIKTEDQYLSISEVVHQSSPTAYLDTTEHTAPVTQTKEDKTPVSLIKHENGYYSLDDSEKCCICHETFESGTILRKHYIFNHYDKTNKTISCICCKYETNDARSFVIHGRRHIGEKPYVCMKCGERFISQKMMARHVTSVHDDEKDYKRKCPQCGEWFQQIEAFKLHRHTHTEERSYVCEQCDKRFMYPKSLTVHIRSVHDKSSRYMCAQCGKSCGNNARLKLHMIRHHGGECNYLCTVCGRKFPSNSHLKKHALSHSVDTGGNCYKCTQCDKRFLYESSRNKHIKIVHIGERPFVCIECGKTFKHKNHLNTHVANHSTERNFLCIVCGKMYPNNALLKMHASCHRRGNRTRKTDEKNFACSHCDKKFYDNPARTRHIKSVHDGERPFVCGLCEKMFKQKSHLNAHMTSHATERHCV